MTTQLKEIDPLSCGKILAAIYFGLSLLFIPFFLVMMLIGSHVPSQPGAPNPFAMVAGVGLVFVILIPIFYAFIGFIGGLLLAVFYNLAAKWTGGLVFTFKDVAPVLPPGYGTPLPPR